MENNKNMVSNNTNNQENPQEKVLTITINRFDAQQMFMALNQIPVRGKQDTTNMGYILNVLENALNNQ